MGGRSCKLTWRDQHVRDGQVAHIFHSSFPAAQRVANGHSADPDKIPTIRPAPRIKPHCLRHRKRDRERESAPVCVCLRHPPLAASWSVKTTPDNRGCDPWCWEKRRLTSIIRSASMRVREYARESVRKNDTIYFIVTHYGVTCNDEIIQSRIRNILHVTDIITISQQYFSFSYVESFPHFPVVLALGRVCSTWYKINTRFLFLT